MPTGPGLARFLLEAAGALGCAGDEPDHRPAPRAGARQDPAGRACSSRPSGPRWPNASCATSWRPRWRPATRSSSSRRRPVCACWSRDAGRQLAVQHGLGLNAGLREARAEALGAGVTRLAVIHGDLPELTAADVTALLDAVDGPAAGGPAVAIAPDAAGRGTNGLALSPPDVIAFHFGPDSLAAHREAALRSGARDGHRRAAGSRVRRGHARRPRGMGRQRLR